MWTGKDVSHKHVKVFECGAFAYILKDERLDHASILETHMISSVTDYGIQKRKRYSEAEI